MPYRPVTPRLIAVVLLMAATACGSTVQNTGGRAVGSSGELGSTEVASIDGGQGVEAGLGDAGSTQQVAGATNRSSTPRAAASAAAAAAAAKASGAGGPVTIRIGWELEESATATRAAFGIKPPAGSSDPEAVVKAIVDHINAHGGMGGHKLEVVTHYTNLTNGTWDTQGQATCSDFAEDKKVFAVVSAITRSEAMVRCLANKRIPLFVYRAERFVSVKEFDQVADYLYLPLSLNYHRGAAFIDALAEQGFMTKQSKIGLITLDHPLYRPFSAEVVRPRLAQLGFKVTDERFIYTPPTVAGLAQSSADINSAVLRFNAAGIDRVIFTNTAGVGPVFFLREAEAQAYRPMYGIASWEYPQTFVQVAPAEQLVNTRGIGWGLMDLDVPEWGPPTGKRAECRSILDKAGFPETVDIACEPLFMLDAAFDRSPVATVAGLRAGIESLGRDYASSITLGSVWGPGRRHDGAGAYRKLTYNTECTCFKHEGPLRVFP